MLKRLPRWLRVLVRAGLMGLAALNFLELVQGAPAAVDWLSDAGVASASILGPVLAAALAMVFGLLAVGPERAIAWGQRLRSGEAASVRVVEHPRDVRVPLHTAPRLEVSEAEMARIAADRKQATTPLERWLEERLRAQTLIAQERAVRGERAYLAAMHTWDVENVEGLYGDLMAGRPPTGIAPELVESYRAYPCSARLTDGPLADPYTTADDAAYFERRVDWLRDTLAALRSREPLSDVAYLRALSRDGHRLRDEMPAQLTVRERKAFEPRVDAFRQRARDVFLHHAPELIGDIDAIPEYHPADFDAVPLVDDPPAVDGYTDQLIELVDRATRASRGLDDGSAAVVLQGEGTHGNRVHVGTVSGFERAFDIREGASQNVLTSGTVERGATSSSPASPAFVDRLAGLYVEGKEHRDRVSPESPPHLLVLQQMRAWSPLLMAQEQRRTRVWDRTVQAELVREAQRFVPEWDAAGSLADIRAVIGVPLATVDAETIARFYDAKLRVLQGVVRELRHDRP